MPTPNEILLSLKDDPETALGRYLLVPRGAADAGEHQFWLECSNAATGKLIVENKRQPFHQRDKGYPFQAYNIPAVKTDTIAGLRAGDQAAQSRAPMHKTRERRAWRLRYKVEKPEPIDGILGRTDAITIHGTALGLGDDDPDLMITTQFSGCSFMMQKTGGSVVCAHLWPQAPLNPRRLHSILMQSGVFAGQPTEPRPVVYGANFYFGVTQGAKGAIVGVRKDGAWRLYHQMSDGLSKIHQVVQII